MIVTPIVAGSSFFFMVPQPIYKVEGQGMWNFYVEFLIRRAKSPIISRMRESKTAGMLLFSILNACVMFGFVKKAAKNFWFVPLKLADSDEGENVKNCDKIHGKLSCRDHWMKVRV